MHLDHAWIASRIPHQGAMCLIDEVLDWSATDIRCRTASHRLTSNPLRTMDRLRAECGIEYAAQAIAIHGVLNTAPHAASPVAGMLASVRGVTLQVDRLDDIDADLVIRGARISGDATALMYEFSIACESKTLLAGRATIVLRRPSMMPTSTDSHK
jgi:predicted hotdog family 3-hydroxylacyl-ACP dehydratase